MADGSSLAAMELLLVGGLVGWLFYTQASSSRRNSSDSTKASDETAQKSDESRS